MIFSIPNLLKFPIRRPVTLPTSLFVSLLLCLLSLTACAPKVYIIDRATVLEQESGGEWPDVDAALRQNIIKTSPAAVKTSESSDRKNKLLRQLEPDQSIKAPARPTGH